MTWIETAMQSKDGCNVVCIPFAAENVGNSVWDAGMKYDYAFIEFGKFHGLQLSSNRTVDR